ncbi:hypothetical protein [Microvirga makkahensis]|uniref:DUF2946 domain-containing protein n=1 Tax=Microvirga makkahensis TaxID=1128670 RepID=A0A7X3MUJ1_9HYPH|nr:hypothetical protein [Microvirga makkahensis]MXQ13493.1 hypothetical protein [Microvirga makkahensis]
MTRMAPITSFRRAVLTALTAYVLVLQTVFASFGGAAHAAQAAGPGGILCLQDGQTRPDPAPANGHDGLCCTLSCHGGGAAGPAPAFVPAVRLAPVTLDEHVQADPSAVHLFSTVLPVGSRAPPRLG